MKILTVGCSFTSGAELRYPNTDAWPAVLASTNNWELNNRGKGGGSNDRSMRVVFEEIDKGYDLIVFAWTVPDRFEVASDNGPINIHANAGKVYNLPWVTEFYARHYDRLYSYTRWLRNAIMLQSYLKSRNQRYLFCSTFGMHSDLRTELYKEYSEKLNYLIEQVDKDYYVDWPEWGMTDWMGDCPKGPRDHPLELGHQRIAEKINEHIRNLGWLS